MYTISLILEPYFTTKHPLWSVNHATDDQVTVISSLIRTLQNFDNFILIIEEETSTDV